MEKYCSELINESFYSQINRIKAKAGFVEDTSRRKILKYTFIFVYPEKCKSIYVEESELETTTIEDNECANVVVLLNTETMYFGYWNRDYELIGIFDKSGRESPIRLGPIGLKSMMISSDFGMTHYNSDLVQYIDIIVYDNPFCKYTKKVLKPVRRAIASSFQRDWMLWPFDLEEEEFEMKITIHRFIRYQVPFDFDDILRDLKGFSEKLENSLYTDYGTSKFKPENYTEPVARK